MSVCANRVSFYSLLAVICCFIGNVSAQEVLDEPLEGTYELWSPTSIDSLPAVEETFGGETFNDDAVAPVQMLTPQRRTSSTRTARLPGRPTTNSRRNSRLASVPFMIGDTGAGSCISYGNFLDVDLGHPTLACSRLNISEANTPVPIDRLYYSYRHFHNATNVNVPLFSFSEDFNIDRHTFGGERTFFDQMMSFELRVPIEDRLNSQVGTSVSTNPTSTIAPVGNFPLFGFPNNTQVELANMSMIFKALLVEREKFALSAGLGVTLPTARDVTYDARIDSLVQPINGNPLAYYQLNVSAIASNESIYLSPFLAWIYQKNDRFFHQGFMQIETAANDSFFTAGGIGILNFDTNGNGNPFDATDEFLNFIPPVPIGIAELQPQTLLRLNLGWGYVLSENTQADWIQKLTGLFELHYTTTLNDAKISQIQLFTAGSSFTGFGLDSIDVGNENNRIDILNVVLGLSANVGNWVVTNGVTAPIRTGADRGFDFEYNLQLQRPF